MYDAADGWEFLNLHSQKIGIRTTTLEEKNGAVELLAMYAARLKVGEYGFCTRNVSGVGTSRVGEGCGAAEGYFGYNGDGCIGLRVKFAVVT